MSRHVPSDEQCDGLDGLACECAATQLQGVRDGLDDSVTRTAKRCDECAMEAEYDGSAITLRRL